MSRKIEYEGSTWILFKGKVSTQVGDDYELVPFEDEFASLFHPVADILLKDGCVYIRLGSKYSKMEFKDGSKYYDREKCDDCSCSD